MEICLPTNSQKNTHKNIKTHIKNTPKHTKNAKKIYRKTHKTKQKCTKTDLNTENIQYHKNSQMHKNKNTENAHKYTKTQKEAGFLCQSTSLLHETTSDSRKVKFDKVPLKSKLTFREMLLMLTSSSVINIKSQNTF